MKSGLFFHLICLAVSLNICFAFNPERRSMLRTDSNLMDFMIQTRAIQQRNPTQSQKCFNYYLPLLTEISEEYETSYNACLETSDNALESLDASYLAQRQSLLSEASDSCSKIEACSSIDSAVDGFECLESAGSNNSKDFYSISTAASNDLLNVRERVRLIQVDEYRCTNASEQTYVQNSGNTYEQMQNCLLGLSPVPTTTEVPSTPEPTTLPPTTIPPTTIPPTQTTQAVPETTERAPEETTEAALTTEAN